MAARAHRLPLAGPCLVALLASPVLQDPGPVSGGLPAGIASPAPGQDGIPTLDGREPLAEVLRRAADADDDASRELALRQLVERAESPVAELRRWAAEGDWRRTEALVRVLGQRGALGRAELERALSHPRWPVRRAALAATARTAGAALPVDSIRALLADPFPILRREALLALARCDAIDDAQLLQGLDQPDLVPILVARFLLAPARYGAGVCEALLAREATAIDVLLALPGAELGPARQVLLRFVSGSADPALRCLALACLPRESWPLPPVPLMLAALASAGVPGPERLAPQLVPAERTLLLEGLAGNQDADAWQRALPLARGAVVEARHLALCAACPDEALSDLLRWLREDGGLDLRAEAARHLAGDEDLARRRAWMLELAAVPGDLTEVLGPQLHGELADLAFRILARRGQGVELLVPVATATPARHASELLHVAAQVPEGFWYGRLEDRDRRQRWIGARGLAPQAGRPEVRRRLVAAFAGEQAPEAAAAMLAVVLTRPDAEAARILTGQVLARAEPQLDAALIDAVVRAPEAAAAAALARLAGSRLDEEARVLAARRGRPEALRWMLEAPAERSERDLRICRAALARSLVAGDEPLCGRLLGSGGVAPAPAFVRREVGEWIRLRPDLPLGALAEEAFGRETDFEAREVLLTATIAQGRLGPIDALVEVWLDKSDEEAEGLLLTALGTLPFSEHPRQERLLVELLLGRARRDPVRAVRDEHGRRYLTRRLGVLSPLLGPVVHRLVELRPQRFADLLDLCSKGLDPAALSKSMLLRVCLEGHRFVGGIEVLAPLVRLGVELPPWPHEADAGLLLLDAELLAREGRYREALLSFDRGWTELTLQGFRSRELETLVLGLLGPFESGPWRQLRKRRALLEAAFLHREGREDEARAAVERARRAAEGAFDDEERRFLRGIASPPAGGRR